MLIDEELSEQIIGAAIEVHRALGPGLLESAYQICMARELSLRNITFRREVPLPIRYKGVLLTSAYVMDFVVENRIILELKSVDKLLPIHEAQLMTYLRLSGNQVALLINFNIPLLRNAIVRRVT